MNKNKILDNYLEKEFDSKETLSKIHLKINKNSKVKILNSISILSVITILLGTTSVIYARRNWQKEYQEYLNRNIQTAIASSSWDKINGEIENLNMGYIYQDGIGIKIDSLLITDYTCQIDFDFKMTGEQKENKAFKFGFAIYDEQKNIYNVSERIKLTGSKTLKNYEKKLCQELNVKYNPKEYNMPKQFATGVSLNPISINDEKTTLRLELNAKENLPKSKKLYIRVFDVGYSLADFSDIDGTEFKIENAVDFPLSNSEWQFEIEIPEKFYDKTYMKLKLKENIENFNAENIILSETNLSMVIDSKYSLENIISGIKILDEDGKVYHIYKTVDGEKYKLIFNIENALNKKLYMDINIPEYNIDKDIELIK